MPPDTDSPPIPRATPSAARGAMACRLGWAAAASLLTTALAWPLREALDLANIVMLFLLGVVLVAVRWGRAPAALAAVLNVAVFDFFFVAPTFSFEVSDVQYLLTFAVMLGVGLLTGQLTAGLRRQARIAAEREARAQALFELARALSAALQAPQVARLGEAAVRNSFGAEAHILAAAADDTLPVADLPEGADRSLAEWAWRNGRSAGAATGSLPAHAWHFVPLRAPMRVRGLLALRPADPQQLHVPEQRQLLDTLAHLVAIALERVHYVAVAHQAQVDMESERLRNALLAALSHDVRTPLTVLIGLAETLRASRPPLDAAQDGLAAAIAQQAQALHALVHKLLDMARLQSGPVRLRRDWQSVEEVVGTALRAAGPALQGLPVQVQLPADLPLVEFDAVLIERVLVNLLENAARYGAAPLVLRGEALGEALLLHVRDHGAGLPPAWQGREGGLFEKFTRGHAEGTTPGVGLGLAICKAVMDAHGGSIAAATVRGADGQAAGAEFTLRLPRRPPPALPAGA